MAPVSIIMNLMGNSEPWALQKLTCSFLEAVKDDIRDGLGCECQCFSARKGEGDADRSPLVFEKQDLTLMIRSSLTSVDPRLLRVPPASILQRLGGWGREHLWAKADKSDNQGVCLITRFHPCFPV